MIRFRNIIIRINFHFWPILDQIHGYNDSDITNLQIKQTDFEFHRDEK